MSDEKLIDYLLESIRKKDDQIYLLRVALLKYRAAELVLNEMELLPTEETIQ